MMTAGLVNLAVRYRDIVTNYGVAVEHLKGVVRNAKGIAVEVVSPVAETDAGGIVYYVRNHDVRDSAKYAGLFLTVEWQASHNGVLLPSFEKRYDYAPVARSAANATVLFWPLCADPNVVFYEITRRRADHPAPVFVGRSFGACFVDTTVFENEFDARSWQYWIQQYARTPGFLQPDGSDYAASGGPTQPTRTWRTNAPVCVMTGQVVDLAGGSSVGVYEDRKFPEVVFTSHPRHTRQLVGDTYIMPEDVITNVGLDGYFSAVLLQDMIVEFRVTNTYFRGKFIVPRSSTASLADVEIEVIRDY